MVEAWFSLLFFFFFIFLSFFYSCRVSFCVYVRCCWWGLFLASFFFAFFIRELNYILDLSITCSIFWRVNGKWYNLRYPWINYVKWLSVETAIHDLLHSSVCKRHTEMPEHRLCLKLYWFVFRYHFGVSVLRPHDKGIREQGMHEQNNHFTCCYTASFFVFVHKLIARVTHYKSSHAVYGSSRNQFEYRLPRDNSVSCTSFDYMYFCV